MDKAIKNLSDAIKIETVSYTDPMKRDYAKFIDFSNLLKERYPKLFEIMNFEMGFGYSLTGCLKGSDPTLNPVAFISHMDVVAVESSTLDMWDYPPFSGEITDKYIYGRGSLDMKSQLIATVDALNSYIESGKTPKRDVFLFFGHNEEVPSGPGEGAFGICSRLQDLGITLDFLFDEGGGVVTGDRFGIDETLGLIACNEKGYTDIILSSKSAGGHASTPPPNTALGLVCKAVSLVEENPLPPHLNEVAKIFIEELSKLSGKKFANEHEAVDLLLQNSYTAALVKTTFAATKAEGSPSHNILPEKAYALINCRLAPHNNLAELEKYLNNLVPEGVEIELTYASEASAISPVGEFYYNAIADSIKETMPGIKPMPYTMVAGTDSKKYSPVCKNIYKFSPLISQSIDYGTIHSNNERLEIESFKIAIEFMKTLIGKVAF